jgi:hypothetical protein
MPEMDEEAAPSMLDIFNLLCLLYMLGTGGCLASMFLAIVGLLVFIVAGIFGAIIGL